MKLSIHETIRGKPVKVEGLDGRKWMESAGQRVSLGYGWINIELDWPDVFELITVDGVATSAELNSDNRRDDTFVSRELIMVDIDSGMTVPELLEDEFYNQYGAGFYTTPSHTMDAHRFRIMFRLATPATDSGRLRKINRALLKVFEAADDACKDPTRIFYGCANAAFKERTDNLLTDDMAERLVALTEAADAETAAEMQTVARDYAPINDTQRKKIVDLLHKSFVGNYPIWRNIGWGMKAGGFTLKDFQYVTTGMMNAKSPQEAAGVWRDGSVNGDVTMGTVIHFLKQRHGEHCLGQAKVSPDSTQDELALIKRIREILESKQ